MHTRKHHVDTVPTRAHKHHPISPLPAQVSIWWAVYLFSVSATGNWLNWTILGPVFLTLLFVPPGASLDTTEAISVCKYPKYKEYQASVSRFFPWFPNKVYKKQ